MLAGGSDEEARLPNGRAGILELEIEEGRLGLGGGQRWSARGKAEAVQDGADGFGGFDGSQQPQTSSAARTREGVYGEDALQ